MCIPEDYRKSGFPENDSGMEMCVQKFTGEYI